MNTYKVRNDSGNEFEVDEDKIGDAEKDGFLPVVSNGKEEHRVSSADIPKAMKDGYRPLLAISQGESAFRAGIQGLAGEFGEELGGLMEAGGAAVGIRGLGSPYMRDIRLETDEEDKEDLVDTYRNMRDRRKNMNTDAERANPDTYLAANVAGGVVGGLAIPGSNTLRGSAALGAVQGLGRSEADLTKGEVGQAALDTVAGGVMGVGGYGLGKGVEKGVSVAKAKGGDLVRQGVDYLKTIGRGAKRGAKEGAEDMPGNWLKDIGAGIGALKGAVNEIKDLNATAKEISGVAREAKDLLSSQVKSGTMKIRPLQEIHAVGNGKSIGEFTDDEAIVAALMVDGDNAVKKWFAQKAAALQPGQIDADEYAKVLGMGAETRNAARDFDPREAAKTLKGSVEEVQNLFKGARSARYGQLQEAAKETFDEGHASAVLGKIDEAIADTENLNSIPSTVKGVLEDVKGILGEGKGIKSQKLNPGEWSNADRGERFNRLQQARMLLDKKLKWTQREGLGHAEQLLRDARGSIDDALKTSPEKVRADSLYRNSKDVEGKFFGATEFKNASGGIDIDEGKISRLFGNTDQANRFKAAMQEMSQFAQNPQLAPEFRAKAAALVQDLERQMAVAEQKATLGSFRYKNGPSSPAIERMQSATKGNTLLKDAVQSPAGFTNQLDQFNKVLKDRLGKGFDALDESEKNAAVKWFVWMKNNPDASQATADKTFAKFFGTGKQASSKAVTTVAETAKRDLKSEFSALEGWKRDELLKNADQVPKHEVEALRALDGHDSIVEIDGRFYDRETLGDAIDELKGM